VVGLDGAGEIHNGGGRIGRFEHVPGGAVARGGKQPRPVLQLDQPLQMQVAASAG
jgi:hypothetical protein